MLTKMLRPLNTAKYISDLYRINIDKLPQAGVFESQKDNFVLLAFDALRCFGASTTSIKMMSKILKRMIGFSEHRYGIGESYNDFPLRELFVCIGAKSIFELVEVAGVRMNGTDIFLTVYDRKYANKLGVTTSVINITSEPEKRFIVTLLAPKLRRIITVYISSIGTEYSDNTLDELSQIYNTYCHDVIDDHKYGVHSLVTALDKLRIEGDATIDCICNNS
jgi:hypothetical protein